MYGPYGEVANRWANFNLATATVMVAGQNGVGPTAGLQGYWKDFAPRFGFAYQPFAHTVVREAVLGPVLPSQRQ